jgi:hypothetical protein
VDDLDPVSVVDGGLVPFRAAYDPLVYFDGDALGSQIQFAHQFSQDHLIMV